MQTRRLGKTGYDVTEIGLGCWQLGGDFGAIGDDTAHAILETAFELGVNFWDTADVYGAGRSETLIGAENPKSRGVTVATKLGRGPEIALEHFSRDTLTEALAGSARRLGVETLDLAQLHCIPIEVLRDGEVFALLDDLKADGLIRHYGASVETIEQALAALEAPNLATLQIIFNLFRQDYATEILPRAQAADVGVIVRLPLASGLLTGKFGKSHRFAPEDHRTFNRDGQLFNVGETFSGLPFETGVDLVAELEAMKPEGWPLSHLAIRWLLDQPGVSTVIAGVSKPDQLRDNVAAAGRPPVSDVLQADLASFYADKVRPHIRGGI
jgi:aryl-alcohol dehydrogenase-like predicted oxidoreductase